jgi:hypothetical protein
LQRLHHAQDHLALVRVPIPHEQARGLPAALSLSPWPMRLRERAVGPATWLDPLLPEKTPEPVDLEASPDSARVRPWQG